RTYLHAVIDNFSRRIVAWRVAETFAPVNSVAGLVGTRGARAPPRKSPNLVGAPRGGKRDGPSGEGTRPRLAAPGVAVHGTEIFELDDRSVVALPEIPVALPPSVG